MTPQYWARCCWTSSALRWSTTGTGVTRPTGGVGVGVSRPSPETAHVNSRQDPAREPHALARPGPTYSLPSASSSGIAYPAAASKAGAVALAQAPGCHNRPHTNTHLGLAAAALAVRVIVFVVVVVGAVPHAPRLRRPPLRAPAADTPPIHAMPCHALPSVADPPAPHPRTSGRGATSCGPCPCTSRGVGRSATPRRPAGSCCTGNSRTQTCRRAARRCRPPAGPPSLQIAGHRCCNIPAYACEGRRHAHTQVAAAAWVCGRGGGGGGRRCR
jgi:hypothetical protein